MISTQVRDNTYSKDKVVLHVQQKEERKFKLRAQQSQSSLRPLSTGISSRASNIIGATTGTLSALFVLWSLEIGWADSLAVARNVLFIMAYGTCSAFLWPTVLSKTKG